MALFILFIAYTGIESIYLERRRKRLKWRLAIGGIRGKSSVTRLIAGALREAGIRVLARTTGSRAMVIFPDGHEEEIRRSGPPNILEGKGFLSLAHKIKAEAIVVELMAIKPECLEAEVNKIFKPHGLVFTNFRPDHLEELGKSRQEVAKNLLRAVEKGQTVFMLAEEVDREIERLLQKKRSHLISVSQNKHPRLSNNLRKPNSNEPDLIDSRANYGDDFIDNIRLALAVIRYLNVNEEVALSGMKKVKSDFGSLKIWEIAIPGKAPSYAVSAFAANEPFSSSLVIERVKEIIPWEGKKIYGLLLFRQDRGDRTEQWLRAIEAGFFAGFDGLFLCRCPHFPLIFSLKKIRKVYLNALSQKTNLRPVVGPEIKKLKPEEALNLVAKLSRQETEPWILIGLGNIVGLGSKLIELWEKAGRRIHG
ncbi:MAG: poly-gamma-glutamate synthase PgsB [Candidatus Aminicenantes bacterium]|nr:poly-gamma-glutamate synthase PgsB [Candidatus Aminicenantes bacterium]